MIDQLGPIPEPPSDPEVATDRTAASQARGRHPNPPEELADHIRTPTAPSDKN